MLMKQGNELETVFQYHQAFKLDSMAVEAYGSLGQYEYEKENFEKAYEYFNHAFKCMNVAKFYRSSSPESLKDAIVSQLQSLEEILGEVSCQKPTVSVGIEIGRNDPCPCGSGKKYKKCCLNNVKTH